MQNQKAVPFHSLPKVRGSHPTFIIENEHKKWNIENLPLSPTSPSLGFKNK
jgi:hypothetical protein